MNLATLKLNNSRTVDAVKSLIPPAIYHAVYQKLIVKDIASKPAYKPHYSPWLEPDFVRECEQVRSNTGLKKESLYTLRHFLGESLWLEGDVMECGVWRGGSARMLHQQISESHAAKRLHLFDSFEGMKRTDAEGDRHQPGDFDDTSLDHVRAVVLGSSAHDNDAKASVAFHKGWIPDTFTGLEDLRFCFAHIDLDLYRSIHDALAFIYPRLAQRGAIVFDDYGFASCPGARKAVDEFFADKPEQPFALHTAQAVVIKR